LQRNDALLVDTYNGATSHGRFDIDFIRLKETAATCRNIWQWRLRSAERHHAGDRQNARDHRCENTQQRRQLRKRQPSLAARRICTGGAWGLVGAELELLRSPISCAPCPHGAAAGAALATKRPGAPGGCR